MDVETFDPCDACGQRSYVWVVLKSGRELSYCGHHATQWWDQFNAAADSVVDLRHMIGYT